MNSELNIAMLAVRSVIETYPYDANEAVRAVQRLAALTPSHINLIAQQAEQAIAKSIEHSGSGYNVNARNSLRQLLIAIERSSLRVVK